MNLSGQIATSLLEMIGMTLWGFRPNLMRDIVEQHGAGSSISWFVRNMPTYERTLSQWGPIRTHLLAVEISVLNGCPYCTYGHAYALELHYFKQRGTLMPVDEKEITGWHSLDDATAIERFRQLIDAADLPDEHAYLERMVQLRQGAESSGSSDDVKILHLLSMFSFLNRCGIGGKTHSDQAHDPINKDAALRSDYNRQRSAQPLPVGT